jgi:uncharacterized membrane protein
MVDRNALRANQSFTIGLLVAGFILSVDAGGAWIVLAVGTVMALGAFHVRLALFQQVYLRGLRPLGLLRSAPRRESATPHRFANALGSVFSLASALILLLTPALAVGWALAWIVIVLASVTLFAGFCVGCFVYLQLDQRGLLPKTISDRARGAASAA